MYKDMEERIKELARRITNSLLACDDFTYDDMACAITYLASVMDRIIEEEDRTKSGAFSKMVYDMIGEVCNASSDKPTWRPSTEHPAIDEEVIVLIGEYNKISFAHIVDKDRCFDYDGWNIPEVKCWIPCPQKEED